VKPCPLLAATLAAVVASAGAGPPSAKADAAAPAAGASAAERARAWADVQALVADATCRSDDQCHVIGVGARACGGPARYIAWSSRVTDGAALEAAAHRQAELDRAAQRAERRVSDCRALPVPLAQCSPVSGAVAGAMAGVGRCVIPPGRPAAARPR